MVDKKVNFELVPDMDQGDEHEQMSGHATSAVVRDTINGPVVEKVVKNNGPFAQYSSLWLAKQLGAADIVNQVRSKHNPHYHVPKTFISHGRVREEFVDGISADKYPGNKADLIPAIAHFINDMSELHPVQYMPNTGVPGIFLKDVAELDDVLDKVRKFNVVKEENLKFIHDVFVFLRDMPENNTFVFGHNDLHPGNVLVNLKNGRVSVIDFELSGYQPMSYWLYNRYTAKPALWDYVNKLPRTMNPGVRWNFDACVDEMYSVINRVLFRIESAMVYDHDMAAQRLEGINMLCNPIVRKKFATLKLTYSDTKADNQWPLVPMSHYERG